MASQLTRDEVAHIADLARLELSTAEQETFARELTDILKYAAMVQEADTSGVDRTEDPATLAPAAWRDDVPVPGIDRATALAEAPDGVPDSGFFRVPKVI